jgi:hypothetical protein
MGKTQNSPHPGNKKYDRQHKMGEWVANSLAWE